jgi:hypothetical protein
MGWFNWFRKKKPRPIVDNSAVLPGNRLLGKLLKTWPTLNPGRLWKADAKYIMPTKGELEKAIFKSPVPNYEYIPEIEDCDDFALLLQADIIRKRYKDYKAGKIHKEQQYPWTFGQIWYQSPEGTHAINLCVTCDKGVLLIEPQGGKIRKPNKDMVISFIRI